MERDHRKETEKLIIHAPFDRLRTKIACLLLLLAAGLVAAQNAPAVASYPSVQDRSFFSASLGRAMHYMVFLPAGYDKSNRRFAVVYLLHGWSGDYTNFSKLTRLADYEQEYPFIIVTPDAKNSWYIDSMSVRQDRFEDYLVKDLISEVDSNFRTIAFKDRRAIAGLSMGGYGAVLYGLKHPEMFAIIGSFSGAFEGPTGIETLIPALQPSLLSAFGPMGSESRKMNDVYVLSSQLSRTLPYFFIDCGAQDKLLPSNRKLIQSFATHSIAYEYHEYQGNHDWTFWGRSVRDFLKVAAERMDKERETIIRR